MPRYRADYSYLDGRTPEQAFAEAYEAMPFGNAREWPVIVNWQMIGLFEGRERLALEEAVEAFAATLDPAAVSRWSPEFVASRAGNAFGWAVRLGILEQAVERGRYVWTLRDREPRWEADRRGHARQIRGLPDGDQAELNRKRAAQAKAAATRQARAAEANAPRIEAAVNSLLIVRSDYIAPEHPMWREALPNALLPCPLVELRPMLLEAHHAMDPHRQRRWLHALETMCFVLRYPGSVDRGPPPGERGVPLPLDRAPVPAHAWDMEPMADEDITAMEGLV